MANPFGELVDNDKLDTMARYVDKPKTQEDRAREAIHLMNENDKNNKAEDYVKTVKTDYGDGASTLCLVYNATGDTLTYVTDHDWYGNIGRTPYPLEIGNGQWASFLHVHTTSASSGSEAALVLRGKNNSGQLKDFFIGWSTPWGPWYKNKAYSDVGAPDYFQKNWDTYYDKLNNSGYSDSTNREGVQIEVDTATGSSPIFRAILKTPYNP